MECLREKQKITQNCCVFSSHNLIDKKASKQPLYLSIKKGKPYLKETLINQKIEDEMES